jgi:predicted nucleic acid-binding Zn ribbon protein
VAHLLDPYHFCPVCNQPTENQNLCDRCMEDMGLMLRRYEADVHTTPQPRKAGHNE